MLIVGHTHDELDRFFSRLKAALAGRSFYTVPQMLKIIQAKTISKLNNHWNDINLLLLRRDP